MVGQEGDRSTLSEKELTAEEIHDEMEVLEPYTAGELASRFDAPKKHIRKLLERLSSNGKNPEKGTRAKTCYLDTRRTHSQVPRLW